MIYVVCQTEVSLDYYQALVSSLHSEASVQEDLALMKESVGSLSLTLVPLESNFLFASGPLLIFASLYKSHDAVGHSVCSKSNTCTH